MTPISSPIRTNDSGPAVRNLHEGLVTLIKAKVIALPAARVSEIDQALRREQETQTYGATTEAILQIFRTNNNLSATGQVDEPTARALNQALRRIGALPLESVGLWIVSGTIRTVDSQGAVGSTVAAYDLQDSSARLLGRAEIRSDRSYRLTYDDAALRNGAGGPLAPDLFVRVFDSDNELLGTSALLNGAPRSATLDVVIPGGPRVVRGRVTDPSGLPLQGLSIRAEDRDMVGNHQLLGQTITDKSGTYRITYTVQQSAVAEIATADAKVIVLGPDDVEIAASDVVFNAPVDQVIDIVVQPGNFRGPSEHRRNRGDLVVLAAQTSLGQLTDAQLAFASRETGIPLDHLHYVRLDEQWTTASNIPPGVFYGLFRKGLPTDERKLFSEKPTRLRNALEAASSAAENIIDPLTAGQVDQVLALLREKAVSLAFQAPTDSKTTPPVGVVLATSSLPAPVQRKVVEFMLTYDGDDDDILNALEKDGGLKAAEQNAVRFTLEAEPLLFSHLPALASAQKLRRERRLNGAGVDLASFSPDELKRIAAESTAGGMPKGFENSDAFAKAIGHRIEQAFPTAVFAVRMAARNVPAERDVLAFLRANASFDLLHTPIDTFLDKGAALGQVRDRLALRRDLKKIVRVARCVPDVPNQSRFEVTQALLANGYDSALKIATSEPGAFIGHIAPIAGRAAADQLIATARARLDTSNLYLLHLRDLVSQPVGFLPRAKSVTGDAAHWAGMFGNVGGCECKHCRSVYSPAAYMVDLLQFLQKVCVTRASTGACVRTLRDVLLERRPDIGHLLCNCENANIRLPYIDLVNQVLEDAVASTGPDGVFVPPPAIAVPGRDATADQLAQYGRSIARYQTSSPEASRRTQAEHEAALRAEPEHELPPAAQQLSDAVFPWTLPFSEPDEKTWILAEHLGLPLSEVVELFRTARGASAGTDAEIVRADLHISAQQWNLLVAEPVGDARRFWGGADTTSLAEMPNFLARTGLSYVEVEALAGSWFFSSRGTPLLRVQPGADRCDIRTYRVLGLEGEDVLDRLHRFLRLRQQLGWSLDALDGMLAAFGQHAIDEHALLNARLVRKVAGLLRLSIEATTKLFVLPSRDDERERRTRAWAHAFRLRTEEFMQLVKVAGATLLESTQTTAVGVLRLIELRSAIEQSGFSIGELAYLLMHEDQAPPAFAPHESDLRAFLTGLHSFVGETTAEKHRLAEAERLRELDEFKKAEPPPTEEAIEARRSELFGRDRFKIADEIEELVVVNLAGFIGASVEVTARLLQNTTADDGTFVSPAILRIVSDPTRPAPATADFLAFAQFDPGPGAIDVTGTDEYRNALRLLIRLIKAARLASAFDLGVQELSAFQLVRATNDFLDFNELPFESAAISVGERERRSTQWHALASAAQLRKSLPKSHQNLFSFLVHPQLAEASPERLRDAATYEYLSEHTGWSATDLAALQAGFGFRGEDFRRVDAYRRLATAVEWMRRWKISPANLVLLGTAPRSGEETQVLVTTLAGLGRAKHQDDTAWFTTLAPLMDVVREKKRDALLGYLLHHRMTDDRRTRQFADSTAVYGHYLIDPEMSACQLTSRIVQAHAAIQLFVQRCRMSLEEPRVSLGNVSTTELWGQWDWMKNYRVWEANRKIFLYPENWIEPDLRDDKSPFFEELESELLQNEVTQESAEGACRNYLAKLDEVARLDVRGLYEEVRNEGGQEEITLHVVARTYSAPHVYFYRKRTADRIWTPWEKIELSIEGDHVFPVVHNGRLTLFWAIFTEDDTYWQLKLQWSIYRGRQWEAPRSGSNSYVVRLELRALIGAGGARPRNFSFRLTRQAHSEELLLCLLANTLIMARHPRGTRLLEGVQGTWIAHSIAFFRFDTCKSALELVETLPSIRYALAPHFIDFEGENVGFVAGGSGPTPLTIGGSAIGTEDVPLDPPIELTDDELDSIEYLRLQHAVTVSPVRPMWTNSVPLLGAFGDRFEVVGGIDDFHFDVNSPFFVEGGQRSYLVSRRVKSKGDKPKYQFETFYHPYCCAMLERLNRSGLDALLNAPASDFVLHRQLHKEGNPLIPSGRPRFATFSPTDRVWRNTNDPYYPHPYEHFDFSRDGAYSIYNWELFFHIPLLVADRLTKENRFELAHRWYQYIFDPTDVSIHPEPAKYWKVKPLFEEAQKWEGAAETIEEMVRRLALGSQDVQEQIAAWRENPFNPHLLARLRLLAYMKVVCMKYMDNLIAWGDHLFLQDTPESITQATQLYLMVSAILRERPTIVSRDEQAPQSFLQLESRLDDFSNARVDVESTLPAAALPSSRHGGRGTPPDFILYFCTPQNEKLLGYWDTVADRLFKIRNCMNIEGRIRQLPLFAPPIDPALLVRARAAGLDLHDVISGARRLPHHRFQLLLPKALEFCAEVRSLGGALLSALEKVDAEKIALLRSGHEVLLFKRMRDVKQLQVDEAEKSLEALRASRPIAEARRAFYAENAAEYKTAGEEEHLDKLNQANNLNITAQSVRLGASIAHATPDFLVGTVTMKWGGSHVGHALNAAASVVELIATQLNFDANMASISASYDRRREDWLLQADLAAKECVQIDKQILTAEIRCDIARRDLANHEQQIAQAEEIKAFHEGKFTSAQLCNWMSGQIGALYFQAYKMAYELARMAEMAAEYELGLATGEMRIVQPGSSHWDSLRKGLLAGDRLHQDLRRLEMVYLERNSRTHEITKHVSLRQLNPLALMGLRGNGVCDFELPKALFDLDFPGHDRRRIKSVAISVPCVVGPYTSVSGTLTLVSHGSADAGVSYVPVSSIATSTGQNDSGVFELNFRDERYLPFEGADPVSSHWRFGLPQEFRTFDYDTISDVILHIRYTARDRTDGAAATVEELKGGFNQLHAAQGTRGLKLLISVKHDFPAEWRALQAETNDAATHPIAIGPTLFPFFVRGQFRMTDVRPVLTSGALGDNLMTGAAPRAGEPVAVNVTRQHRYLVGSYSLQ